MGEWQEFFLAQAGAAGVLVGLVFVGVSIHLEKILSDPDSGLTGRAAEVLILLVTVLTASTLLLVPGQGTTLIGTEVLAVGLAAWGWVGVIQMLSFRNWRTIGPDLRGAFVLRAALNKAATLPFVVAGIAVLAGGLGGSTGLRRAWSSRSSWRCSVRGCCSSRSTARRSRGPVTLVRRSAWKDDSPKSASGIPRNLAPDREKSGSKSPLRVEPATTAGLHA